MCVSVFVCIISMFSVWKWVSPIHKPSIPYFFLTGKHSFSFCHREILIRATTLGARPDGKHGTPAAADSLPWSRRLVRPSCGGRVSHAPPTYPTHRFLVTRCKRGNAITAAAILYLRTTRAPRSFPVSVMRASVLELTSHARSDQTYNVTIRNKIVKDNFYTLCRCVNK